MTERKFQAPVIATIILGVVVLGLSLALVGRAIAYAATTRAISEQEHLLTRTTRSIKQRTALHQNYERLSQQLGMRLPGCSWSEQMPFMVNQLTGIVEAYGVKIETLQPEPVVTKDQIMRFPLRLSVRADLKSLTKILRDMESTTPALSVDQLSIRNDQKTAGTLLVEMTVSSFVILDKHASLEKRRALVKAMQRNVKKVHVAQEKTVPPTSKSQPLTPVTPKVVTPEPKPAPETPKVVTTTIAPKPEVNKVEKVIVEPVRTPSPVTVRRNGPTPRLECPPIGPPPTGGE